MNTVLTFIKAHRHRLALERYGLGERISSVVVTPRFRASRHVVFLLLTEGSAHPVLVAKIPRLASCSGGLEREVMNLRSVHGTRSGGFCSIPRVVAFEQYGDRPILVETALVGRPMDPALVRRRAAYCCTATSKWLLELQRPQHDDAGSDACWFDRLVEHPLGRFANVFPLSSEESRLLDDTRNLADSLRQLSLPLVSEHGDLSHPNVMLLERGGVGAVDWELGEPCGLPTHDLFFFLAYSAFALGRARTNRQLVQAFHRAFFRKAAWARPYAIAYAKHLQIEPQALTPLFVLCWARYTIDLLFRVGQTPCPSQPVAREQAAWLRANRYYTLWRHALFHRNQLDWRDTRRLADSGVF